MYLNCHSYYSLRYGTFSVEALVEKAAKLKVKTLALTDINNSSGVIDFVRECEKRRIRPVGGMEFRNGDEILFIGIARNNFGFRELNEYMSAINLGEREHTFPAPDFKNVYIIYPYGKTIGRPLKENEYIGIKPTEVSRLIRLKNVSLTKKLVVRQPVTFSDNTTYY